MNDVIVRACTKYTLKTENKIAALFLTYIVYIK